MVAAEGIYSPYIRLTALQRQIGECIGNCAASRKYLMGSRLLQSIFSGEQLYNAGHSVRFVYHDGGPRQFERARSPMGGESQRSGEAHQCAEACRGIV
jgi:hypothetical protein